MPAPRSCLCTPQLEFPELPGRGRLTGVSHRPSPPLTLRFAVVALVVATIAAACGDDGAGTTSAAPQTTTATTGAPTVTSESSLSTTTTQPFVLPSPVTTLTPIDVEIVPGGGAVIGSTDEPATLNPLAAGGSGTAWDRFGQLYLVGISDVDADLELVPELLVELPSTDNGGITVEEDGSMSVVMEIHPDARWEDGVPISGEDFLFTYQTLRDLEGFTAAPGADADLYRQIIPDSLSVAPKTFAFRMERATLQHELLFPVVLPAHQVAGSDVLGDWSEKPWLSGGPFVVESWSPGERLTFVRNPLYWKTDLHGVALPYLDRVEFRFYDSGAALVDAFRIREVDVINPPPVVQTLDALIPLVAEGAGVFVVPGTMWEHLAFQFGENNRNPDSLNRFADFRRAVAHAIDVEALVTSLYGGYNDSLDSYLDAYTPSMATGAWDRYAPDPIEAERLLDGVCRRIGRDCGAEPPVVVFTTTANDDLRVRMAALLSPMLAEVGIDVRMELEESSLFFGETLISGSWDVGAWAYHGRPGMTALAGAHDLFDPAGPPPFGSNYARWGTAEVSGEPPLVLEDGTQVDVNQGESPVVDESTARFGALRREMETAVDRDDLAALVAEAEQILADQAVVIPLWSRLWIAAVWLDQIAAYEPNVGASGDTWSIERWFRVDLPGE